jgi:GNAT superfamily N-acetyltransferase
MIRKATTSDIDSLNRLFDLYRVFYNQERNLEASKSFLLARFENEDSKIFVAEDSGILVGFVQLYPIFSSTQMKRLWLLNDLFVDERFRGKGYSKSLIVAAKDLAIETNSAGLMLETDKSNLVGNNLYPSVGFNLDKTHNYYFWTN